MDISLFRRTFPRSDRNQFDLGNLSSKKALRYFIERRTGVAENNLECTTVPPTQVLRVEDFFDLQCRFHCRVYQRNCLTHHFADEAQHAWYWTNTLHELGVEPLNLSESYQDRYLKEAGLPANLMEVLAVTQVFEQRVIRQYHQHLARSEKQPKPVIDTLRRIMIDERWHIAWVRKTLDTMREKHGGDCVDAAIDRFRAADDRIYQSLSNEHLDRLEES